VTIIVHSELLQASLRPKASEQEIRDWWSIFTVIADDVAYRNRGEGESRAVAKLRNALSDYVCAVRAGSNAADSDAVVIEVAALQRMVKQGAVWANVDEHC
jgi:hypothetical protein